LGNSRKDGEGKNKNRTKKRKKGISSYHMPCGQAGRQSHPKGGRSEGEQLLRRYQRTEPQQFFLEELRR